MDPEFITYQKFDDPALADALAETLRENGIEYIVQEQSSGFDPSLSLSRAAIDYAIKVRPADFERINALLVEQEEENTGEVDKDYHLFTFTDDELMEVVTKADEWSTFDVVLARKILAERGKSISDETIAEIEEERLEQLKKPDEPQTFWITLGYILAFFGGVLGVFIGWYLAYGKKTLPNGQRVYEYSEHDRRHGRNIFYLSAIFFIVAIVVRFWAGLHY
jgi:hypothetical protein